MTNVSPNLDPDIVARDGELVAVQHKVIEYLRELPILAPIKLMFIEDSMTLEDDLNKAMTGIEPMSIGVSIGDWTDSAAGTPGRLELDNLQILITVFENPILSRKTGGINLTLNRVILSIATALKCRMVQNSYLDKPRIQGPAEVAKDTLVKTLSFRTALTVLQPQTETDTP